MASIYALTVCNYFPSNSFQLFSSRTLQSVYVEWSCCITTREKAVICGVETGMCALWDLGKEGQKEELLTKHRRNFIFLLTNSQRLVQSLFLLFSCFQNVGWQSLAEVLVGLWLHDLELFAIKFLPFLFTSFLSYPSCSHDILIPLYTGIATQHCVTSIIFSSLPLLILSLEAKILNKYRALIFLTT